MDNELNNDEMPLEMIWPVEHRNTQKAVYQLIADVMFPNGDKYRWTESLNNIRANPTSTSLFSAQSTQRDWVFGNTYRSSSYTIW